MDDKTRQTTDALVDMIRSFKGADFVEPVGEVDSLYFTEDFGLDSLDIINLLFEIDEKFGVKVATDDIVEHQLLIVSNMAAYIIEHA